MNKHNDLINEYVAALRDVMEVDVVYGGGDDILLRGSSIGPFMPGQAELAARIATLPGKAEVISIKPRIVIRIKLPGKIGVRKIPWLNIILFALTLLSTLIVGALGAGVDFLSRPRMFIENPLTILVAGMPFSFSLLGILLFHEFGHYTASRLHGVEVTLPYFLPFPNIIGTMGAVIRIKSPFITRKQLLDVGAAGPLAGLIVAIPLVIWGQSHPVLLPETTNPGSLTYFGESLIFSGLSALVNPEVPQGYIAALNPVAFAGWVGFLVTMLNLLPIGQLDGGHIVYAMFGKIQHRVAFIIIFALVVMSFFWIGWIIWALLGLLLVRPKHPPTVLDDIQLDGKRMAIGYLCLLAFVLCFVPVPFMFS